MALSIRTLDDSSIRVDASTLGRLRSRIRGDLLTRSSPGYEVARAIWNGMIDRHPALIARCLSTDDVRHAVNFARENRLLTAIRGGGHNIAGNAVCQDGFVIDLSAMRGVHVDAGKRTARVDGGCTLADFDREAQKHALATPVGINSTTGIAGLTLGGGYGWLSRRHGMTVDNLRSATVVTADGSARRVSQAETPDLFWAIRGGGGNFGVVTSFEFDLHPVGPEVLAGLVVHPLDRSADLLRFYRSFSATLPDETAVWVVLRKAPPLPFLPEEWHGREVAVLACFHGGEVTEGERILEPLRQYGHPIADVVGPTLYADWQQAFDPLLTPGARNYWKSHNFRDLPDALLDLLVDAAGRMPSPHCEIFIGQTGGAIDRVAPQATAYSHRDTTCIMNVHARWTDPADDSACTTWARRLFAAAAPFATGGVYVNFMPEDEADRIAGAYGVNHPRLVELKDRYDPANLFRMNQNIRPSGAAGASPQTPPLTTPR